MTAILSNPPGPAVAARLPDTFAAGVQGRYEE